MSATPSEDDRPCENTDREIWREREGDYYANSIHVTKEGRIGINCGGEVIVMSVGEWHAKAQMVQKYYQLQRTLFEFKEALEHSHR